MKQKELWLMFYYNNKCLGGYTIRGTFEDEKQNTLELFAYENGCKVEDITTRAEERY